ncbi:MAG: aldolase/citrate lyase family protein [Bacteroidota bacterium]
MAQSLIATNRTKQALSAGKCVVGTMLVELRQPSVMQLLANAGFDFVLIDTEHGPFGIESIADLSRAARQSGVTPIVRVPDITYAHVTQPLDGGAQGIMMPRVTNAQQVCDVVQMMKYPPTGRRGSVLARGHTDFKGGSVSEMMADANKETMLVVQVETQQAVENLDEILSVEGVDVALIGPNDLSIALGVPGKLDDPKLIAAVETMKKACAHHKVFPAIHMNDLERGSYWAKNGMRMVSMNSETGYLVKAGSEAVSTLRNSFATK